MLKHIVLSMKWHFCWDILHFCLRISTFLVFICHFILVPLSSLVTAVGCLSSSVTISSKGKLIYYTFPVSLSLKSVASCILGANSASEHPEKKMQGFKFFVHRVSWNVWPFCAQLECQSIYPLCHSTSVISYKRLLHIRCKVRRDKTWFGKITLLLESSV